MGVRTLMCDGNENGALSFAKVIAGRLACFGRIAEDAKDVVAQLESLAERQAIARQSVDDLA